MSPTLLSKNIVHGRPESIRWGACCTLDREESIGRGTDLRAAGAASMVMTARADDL